MTTRLTTPRTIQRNYTLQVMNGNMWRIYHQPQNQNKNYNDDQRQLLEQYYFHEDASSAKINSGNGPPHTHLQKSFPCHHSLMLASLYSTQKLIARDNRYRYCTALSAHASGDVVRVVRARARAHGGNKNVTHFTQFSAYQKTHLTSQSAMAGLLVSRLFGIRWARPHMIDLLKKHADLTAKYIHSALASEYLIGNRYCYNLPTLLSDEDTNIVGQVAIRYDNIRAEDVTHEKIEENRVQLVNLYNSNIERLEKSIHQFKRGLVSLETIREDPDYVEMFEMFWLVQTQNMKHYSISESGMSAHQAYCESNGITFERRSINIHDLYVVFSCQIVCPKLFCYDIAHLFDNKNQSYAKYIKTTKAKMVQLSEQGLVSAFLAFSAIEPNMVSTKIAPHMEEKERNYPSDFSEYACHIPSRDAIFGPLLSKNRAHISRGPVNIERSYFMTRNNANCYYLPVQDALAELRTGKKTDISLWEKNICNFKSNH